MTHEEARRLNLIDGMILVAATGCGYAAGRARLSTRRFPGRWWGDDLFQAAVCVLFFWSLAVIILHCCRPPRPTRERLTSEPGFVACLAVMACLATQVVQDLLLGLFLLRSSGTFFLSGPVGEVDRLWSFLGISAAHAVLATWVVLIVGRRWRPGRSLIDRFGQSLGLCWLGWGPLGWLVSLGA